MCAQGLFGISGAHLKLNAPVRGLGSLCLLPGAGLGCPPYDTPQIVTVPRLGKRTGYCVAGPDPCLAP
jgi:hypothetical protein